MKNLLLLIGLLFIFGCSETSSTSDNPKNEKTEKTAPSEPVEVTPELITQLEELKFFKRYDFYLSNSWKLSEAYYGPGVHKNFSYSSSSSMGMEAHIKNGDILETISLSNSNPDTALEFIKLFFKDIDTNNLRSYLKANLNRSINQIRETTPFEYEGNKIYAGSVLYGNTLLINPPSGFKDIPKEDELGKKDSYELITKIVAKEFINNLDRQMKSEKLSKKYPLLVAYKESYNLLPETEVYLYYEGLNYGPIYDKPGAKSFGANELAKISFLKGSVKANLIAHKELEGGRNYFYVITRDLQGWMGRPYIMKNKAGDEFFMPNPLTGESIRKALKISSKQVKRVFRSNYSELIPSYESIDWDYRIPERYKREGYDMYVSALSEGYRQHASLVNSYLSGTW